MADQPLSTLAPDERSYILQQKTNHKTGGSIASEDGTSQSDTKQLVENEDNFRNSLPFTSFNYINSIIGSGVIGMPYALHQAGFGLGILLLLLVALFTDYSLVLLVRSGHLSGKFSYQGLMQAAFGRPGYVLLLCLQFMYPFIAMVSYNVVVGDTVTKVLARVTGVGADSLLGHREFVVTMATALVVVPLCLYRNIARLAKISFLSLAFVTLILVFILVRLGSLRSQVPSTDDAWQFANWNVIPAIGIMAFAFMCHHNTFLLYGSIKDADQSKWDTVTHASVLSSFLAMGIFSIAGYATFTGLSQGDLLENYCWDDDLMNLARLLFSGTILLTFPLECFVAREVVQTAFFSDNTGESLFNHVVITLGLVVVALLISLMTECLGIVLAINGVLAAVPLAYVLPAVSYLRLETGPLLSQVKVPALSLAVFGVFVVVTGVVVLAMNFSEVGTCSQGHEMPYCNVTSR
ncbi:putative sodium-coupled neutral amino acid transporter 11 isoform X2 [Bacillus rossius redtenbacheri]|uniref:putative sodium-coupled neutral amino acid transporter 11 isoform X2 n=1 Tax=Bacillus rossius redtenbacheri TaxID=93214 RepID=UPI002FDE9E44